MKEKILKDEVFEEIRRIYNDLGIMNRKLCEKHWQLEYNLNHTLFKFGGLKKICYELNIPYTQYSRIADDELKNDVMRVYLERGHIDMNTYNKYGKYSASAVKTHWGFNKLLKDLNIPVNTSRLDGKEEVMQDICCIIERYGNNSATTYRKYGKYSESVIKRIWGGWNCAMEDLGYTPVQKQYGYDYMLKEVDKIFKKYGFISKELISEHCQFTYEAFRAYFSNKEDLSRALGVKNAFCDTDSSRAKILYNVLTNLYEERDIIKEMKWEWLRNPRTNRQLRIDFYIQSQNIAIEYDGEQHFKHVEFFDKNPDSFKQQVYRDRVKDELLKQHNIPLIRFSRKDKLTEEAVAKKIKFSCVTKL